jgi:hypothetical protein
MLAALAARLGAAMGAHAPSARAGGQVLDSREAAVIGAGIALRNVDPDERFRTQSSTPGPSLSGVSAALPGGPKICDGCQYFNAAAFVQTPSHQFGNVSRRLPAVNTPATYNIDAQFEKNARIRERPNLLFRAELFHAWNQAIFSGPATSIASSTFDKIVLSQANAPGQVQFSLRLRF